MADVLPAIIGQYRAQTMGVVSPTALFIYGCVGLCVAALCFVLMGTTFRRSSVFMRLGLAVTLLGGLVQALGCFLMQGRFIWPSELFAGPGIMLVLLALSASDRGQYFRVARERYGPLHWRRLMGYAKCLRPRRWREPAA